MSLPPWQWFGLRLYGRVNGDLLEGLFQGGPSSLLLPVPLSLCWAPASPHLPRRPSNTSRLVLPTCGLTAPFLWVLVLIRFIFLCPPRLASLFPPVLRKSYSQILLTLKARFPGDPQSLRQIPSFFVGSPNWEAWHGAQNLHNSGRTLVLLFPSLWATHLAGMGFDFIILHPFYHLAAAPSLSLDLGYLFLVFQHPPINDCPSGSCNFGALTGDERMSYSAILNSRTPVTCNQTFPLLSYEYSASVKFYWLIYLYILVSNPF